MSHDRTIDELMSDLLITASPDDEIAAIRSRMHDTGVHCVPVLDGDGHPLGVISSWDLVEESSAGARASTVMTKDVISVTADTTVATAASPPPRRRRRTHARHRGPELVRSAGRGR
jgi:CBS domain-containing protein